MQALDLRVNIHGPNVYSGFVALSGASWVDLPSYAASVNKGVRVSVDDPTFANAGSGPAFGNELERRDPDAERRQAHDLCRVDAGVHDLRADDRDRQRDQDGEADVRRLVILLALGALALFGGATSAERHVRAPPDLHAEREQHL